MLLKAVCRSRSSELVYRFHFARDVIGLCRKDGIGKMRPIVQKRQFESFTFLALNMLICGVTVVAL